MKIFLDTNILLDVLVRREPFYEDSARIWSMAEAGQVAAYVSAISFNNTFYIIRNLENRQKAEQAVKLMHHLFKHVVALDRRIIGGAVELAMDDFEDAIQLASALQCKAEYLITRDPRHFRTDAIRVISAGHFVKLMERL